MALAVLILVLLLPGGASSQYAAATPPSGWSQATSGSFYKPPSSVAWSGSAFQAAARVQVAGKSVTVPASLRMAANGGQYAAPFVRANPLLFVGTSVAAWLLAEFSMDFVNGDWSIPESTPVAYDIPSGFFTGSVPGCTAPGSPSGVQCDFLQYAAAFVSYFNSGINTYQVIGYSAPELLYRHYQNGVLVWTGGQGVTRHQTDVCPTNLVLNGGFCVGQVQVAGDSQWNTVTTANWPAHVLSDVARHLPLPVQVPEITPFVEPLGNPYTDPLTGQPWQDKVRITPDPTPESPWRLRLDPFREPLTTADPEGNPQVDPNVAPEHINPTNPPVEPPPPFELPGFCDWATIVCDLADWFRDEADDPESVDLPELDPVQLSAQNFGLPSSGTCPAPMNLSIGLGAVQVKYDPFCDFATAVRPLVIATGWLAAVMILVGWRRS